MVILLTVLPLAVLLLVVLLFSTMRSMRRVRDLSVDQPPLTEAPDRRRPSDDYHDTVWLPLCTKVAEAASAVLSRPLTEKERCTIWRSRTALVLEILLSELQRVGDAEKAGVLIANLPSGMSRPDPTGWCGMVAGAAPPQAG